MKLDESDHDLEFKTIIGLEANWQVIKSQTKDNFQNGEEYVGLTETHIRIGCWTNEF
jgi:hypothetical protein